MEDQKDAAKVRFFPPGIPILTILLGIGLQQIFPLAEQYTLSSPARYYVGGIIAGGSILLLGFWAVFLFRKDGQSENPWKPTSHIVASGPYRFTRNPMYLQMILVCIGASIAFANWWILLITPLAAWLLQTLAILPEEAYLETKFGESYKAYKRKVRRWI